MHLSIDIGGTKTLVAAFSKRGRVVKRIKIKTARGAERFISDLKKTLKNFQKYKIDTIVVAIPGVVQKNYSVKFGNRDWPNIDIYTPIHEMFDCPIYFENDANLATLYEGSFYSGKTIFLTFSTGIGGGIVENGEILPESAKFEPGHKIYEYDDKKMEWEDIAAASALEKYYHVDRATDLRKKSVMVDVANRVALGLPDIIDKYHPDTIVLGGPLGKMFKRYTKYLPKFDTKFVRPKRPLESVIYGGYLYGRKVTKKDKK